jgi:hypothetical protein
LAKTIKLLSKYYPEIIVFGTILAILIIDLNPDFTYMNKAADSIGYIYSAKYLYPSFHTSAPLYLLLGHLFLMIPVATEAWRFGLLSVFATIGTCLFVYLIVKNYLSRWYALLGTLIVGMSALVISQSIIVETYPLVCMLATGAYYFAIKKKWYLTALFLGAGLAVHLLGVFVLVIFLIGFKQYRKNWKALLITFSFLLFYIYIPIASRNAPPMWLPQSGSFVVSSVKDIFNTIVGLVGTIAIWNVPKRVFDTLGIVGVSVGVVTIIPIVAYFWRKKFYKNILFWLIIIPIGLFISELDMDTFDYCMLAIPFLAIVACFGLDKLKNVKFARYLTYGTLVAVIGLGIFNCYTFNIGTTEDPNMSTAEFYYKELPKIPDGAIFMPLWGWEWEASFLYNKDNNAHLVIVNEDMLVNVDYQKQIEAEGIKLTVSTNKNQSIASKEIAQSIISQNNVWTTVTTDPSTFGAEVVSANHDVNLAPLPDESLIASITAHPPWEWKPSSPYSIMKTSILETQWQYVVTSNYSLFFIADWGGGFFFMYWLMLKYLEREKRKKKANENRNI